jgi:hypothetical protein
MPRGPLPKPEAQRRRRNAPTIPSTKLPAGGRKGRIPKIPEWATLGANGAAFWKWAWSTPQAAGWDDGAHVTLVRRAMLEDSIKALRTMDFGPFPNDGFVIGGELDSERLLEYLDGVRYVCRTLKALAGGEVNVMREARELDNTLGLNPKALAALRWEIISDSPAAAAAAEAKEDEVGKRRTARAERLAVAGS